MSLFTGIALLSGAGLGAGIWLIALSFRARGRVNLMTRVAPWVSDVSPEAHRVAVASLAQRRGRYRSLVARLSERVPQSLRHALDGGSSTRRLLGQAGATCSPEQWRLKVFESGLVGTGVGLVTGLLAVASIQTSVFAVIGLAIVGGGAGLSTRRYLLARQARKRVALILEELPALCELLAICLTAGEGFRDALTRVAARGHGPLAVELRGELARVHLGIPLVEALGELSTRLDVPPLSRLLDHVISSIDRGTPLADVLRVQAAEARAEAGRRLQERASAREVIMLMPLVFLILPITVAFAVFPGLLVIQAGL
jgi:tight adherence protein C